MVKRSKKGKADWRTIRREYERGATFRDLARVSDRSRSTIAERAKAEQWTRRVGKRGPHAKPDTEPDMARLAAASAAGDPRSFLHAVMADKGIDIKVRVDSAKALLRLEPVGSFGIKARAAAEADKAWAEISDKFGLAGMDWGNDLDVPADMPRKTT
jgi:hypothetical protein